jgi:hypothetical protein
VNAALLSSVDPLLSRGGQANFFLEVRKSQILGLIQLSQIRKFLRFTSPQIPNPQIFMTDPHLLANTQIFTNTAQLCLKTVLKVVFLKRFYFFLFWALN